MLIEGGKYLLSCGEEQQLYSAIARLYVLDPEQRTLTNLADLVGPLTGKLVAAKYEHDAARPVDGYAAPQLHTHSVIFNVTGRQNGETRAIQEKNCSGRSSTQPLCIKASWHPAALAWL